MKIATKGRDVIAGGRVFHPGKTGEVDMPEAIARAEGLA